MFVCVRLQITETEVGVTFKPFDNLRLKLHPLAYHGNTWTFKELMQNLKRDIIVDLLWFVASKTPTHQRANTHANT